MSKIIFNCCFITFLLVNISHAQLSSFEKSYEIFENGTAGQQIIEIDESSLLIASYEKASLGSSIRRLSVSKINSSGEILWSKFYNTLLSRDLVTEPIIKIDISNFWLLTSIQSGDYQNAALIKIDENGDSLSTIVMESESNTEFFGSATNGNDYLLLMGIKKNSFQYSKANLVNINSTGGIIWNKKFDLSSRTSYGMSIKPYNTNQFAIRGLSDILIIDSVGNQINLISPLSSGINSFVTEDENFIIGTQNGIIKINKSGEELWKVETTGASDVLTKLNDNTIIVSDLNNLYKLSSEGLIEQTVPIRGMFNYAMEADNFSKYCVGTGDNQLYLIKLSPEFEYKSLELITPKDDDNFFVTVDEAITISWYSRGLSGIDILFSSNNGVNWQSVGNNITASEAAYTWNLPRINSDSCLIKIIGNPDTEYKDQNETPFSITPIFSNSTNYIAANEIFMWIGNNGMSAHNPITDGSGLFWPGGASDGTPAVFVDGVLWGGKIGREIRVNGATYRKGLQPGPILPNGTADDPNKKRNKLYKLTKDWQSIPEDYLREIYEYDYNNWPAQHGAPFIDVNGDGIFTRGVDEPKIIGDETLFYVANDLDSATAAFTYGTLPIGIEYQQTVFAYNTPELKDAVFKKAVIINKGENEIHDMYLAHWQDDDLGNAGDDFVGCDTLLNLAYTYNGDNNDDDNYGEAPPALGRILLQGPITESKYDTAKVGDKLIYDFKNIPMVSHMVFICGNSVYSDPDLGRSAGAEQFYNNFAGNLWDGSPIIDPNNQEPTHYVMPGDPVDKTGWYEGDGWPEGDGCGDRKSVFASGPFDMMPGDTQIVVFTIFLARGTDNINSVAKLKEKALELHEWWGNYIPVSVKNDKELLPDSYSLSQNYPNPFNPTTTIQYTIPVVALSEVEVQHVTLRIYDILGREVATLVNAKQKPGSYKVEWDASSSPSIDGRRNASGIYFYELRTNDFVKTNKMILIK